MLKNFLPGILLAAFLGSLPFSASAQPPAELLLPPSATAAQAGEVGRRVRGARADVSALERDTIHVALFEDLEFTFGRVRVERPTAQRLVWVGVDDYGTQAVFTVARGVLTGTIHAERGTFEVRRRPGGEYLVVEIDPGTYPTDDPESALEPEPAVAAADLAGETSAATLAAATTASTPTEIAVMIVWTPKSETAGGGRSAMESLALNLVANANLVYANSGVNTRLTLAYSGPVSFTETSSASTDVAALRAPSDGKADAVHLLRDTYAADIVTMLGEYKGTGSCGYAYIMTPLSSSFASSAFSVVDRECSLGNLSYAHEVGHNQGLLHNRTDAGGMTPSQPYAYGYQDPSGYFRTVLAYGAMTRIPYLSSPAHTYNGRVTGTSTEDNARTLNLNAATVGAFRGASAVAPAPSCTFALSATSLSFPRAGGTKSVSVSAPAGCAWTATESSAWITLDRAGGTGNGSVTITTTPSKRGSTRKATVTIAGLRLVVRQQY